MRHSVGCKTVTHVPPFTVFIPADGSKSLGVVNKMQFASDCLSIRRGTNKIKSFAYLLDDKSGR